MGGGFVSTVMEAAALAGAVSFVVSGLLWYLYFYRKEKKLMQRLYDIIEQAEESSACGRIKMTDVSENTGQAEVPGVSGGADMECMSGDKDTEEKVSLIEDKFRRFVNSALMENEKNRQQKQVIQGLISDISHQTLTPIANLKLYAELLRELVCNRTAFDVDDSELSEVMDTLCGQTEKLDFLIQSLVKLSRMETGLIGVHVQTGNIQSLFDAVYQEYRKKASEKGITLTFETSRLRAVFDLKWMGEALGNIVDNAVKYTRAGGKVQVSARAYTFFVRIDVADDGIGIAPEDFHRIFTRFYRCLSADDQPGIGIGLYLAREIVQAQRGYMKVASKKGEGSLFSVFLPVP